MNRIPFVFVILILCLESKAGWTMTVLSSSWATYDVTATLWSPSTNISRDRPYYGQISAGGKGCEVLNIHYAKGHHWRWGWAVISAPEIDNKTWVKAWPDTETTYDGFEIHVRVTCRTSSVPDKSVWDFGQGAYTGTLGFSEVSRTGVTASIVDKAFLHVRPGEKGLYNLFVKTSTGAAIETKETCIVTDADGCIIKRLPGGGRLFLTNGVVTSTGTYRLSVDSQAGIKGAPPPGRYSATFTALIVVP